MRVVGINNTYWISKNNNNPIKKNFSSKPDIVSFGNNDLINKITLPGNKNINDMNIDNATIIKPSTLSRLFGLNSGCILIQNSHINDLYGLETCSAILTDFSTIGNIENFNTIELEFGNTIDNIKNVLFVESDQGFVDNNKCQTLNPPKIDNLNAVYLTAEDTSKINTAVTHATYLSTGACINDLTTNKLIIMQQLPNNERIFTDIPVSLENANVIKNSIKSGNFTKDLPCEIKFNKFSKYYKKENCFADIEFCEINNLQCEKLNAKKAKLKNVDADTCDDIINCDIGILKTNAIQNIENSNIDKLVILGKKFDLNIDEKSKINSIEFKEPNGVLVIKNNGKFIPSPNVINGTKAYKLRNIELENFISPKIFTANDDVKIKNLTINKPNAVVTLIGTANIENIHFKNGGKIILQNNANNKHPDINSIKVTNGLIIKDYPLHGLEKVSGMTNLKQQLKEDIIDPLLYPEKYKKYGLDVINGFLMYGPPGCGKTFIAKQLAEETGRYFVEITPSNVGSSMQHETVININKKFVEAIRNQPAIVFLDEVESLAPAHDGLAEWDTETNERVTELLKQINNCQNNNIVVICASNEPQKIDNAIKRTGRMDKKIFVGNPDKSTREALFKQQLQNVYSDNNIDFEQLANKAEYFTAEDIKMVIRDAAIHAMKADQPISQKDLLISLQNIKPSLSKELIEEYFKKGEI